MTLDTTTICQNQTAARHEPSEEMDYPMEDFDQCREKRNNALHKKRTNEVKITHKKGPYSGARTSNT